MPFYDRTQLINRATDTLKWALIEELILVTLANLIFLAHFRSVLIVTVPLPLAVLISFLFMRYFGITSNIMSLAGHRHRHLGFGGRRHRRHRERLSRHREASA